MKSGLGFLFDNDGVLIDSSALHWQAWQLLMKEDSSLYMDWASFVQGFGKRNDLILEEIAPHISLETRQKWAARKEQIFREIAQEKVSLLPGMEDFLKEVKKRRIARIIASSTPTENLKMYLTYTVLGEYFDEFISAEEVAHGKPFPDIFLAAADRIDVAPNRCIVFEDAPAGILAGKKANCFVVALQTTHTKEDLSGYGYDMLYPSAKELDLDEILTQFKKSL